MTTVLAPIRQRLRAPRRQVGLPRLWPVVWVTLLPLAMMVATEYKLRQRELSESLSGQTDPAIIFELVVYGLVVLYLVLFVVSPPRLQRPTAIQFLMRGYALAMFASVAYGTYPKLGFVRGAQLLVLVMTASAIAMHATRRQVLQLAHTYVGLVTASVFVGLFYRVPFSGQQEHRFSWMHVHPVTCGAMLALGIVICTALGTNRSRERFGGSRWPRWMYLGCLVVMVGGLIGTETRGAIAAAAAGEFAVIYFTVPKRERLPLGIIASLGIGLVGYAFWDRILTYLARGENVQTLSTINNRTKLWAIAWGLVKERPITGWGLATSRGIFFDKVGLGGAHNAVVNVTVDAGIVGLLLWLSFVAVICLGIARAYRRGHHDAPLLAGVMMALMVNGLTVEGVGSGIGASFTWLLLCGAWVGVLQRDVTDQEQRQLAASRAPSPARSIVLETSRV